MRDLQVRNRQRDQRLDSNFLRAIARTLLEGELGLQNYELGIEFVSATKMAKLNWDYLQHEGSTDVITFDYREGYEGKEVSDPAGEIYISVADAKKQAREFRRTWQEELVRYVVHGVLHLQGYDDLVATKRKVMKREENRLVRKLSKRFNLRHVAV